MMVWSSLPVCAKSGHCVMGQKDQQQLSAAKERRRAHGVDLEKGDIEGVVDEEVDSEDFESIW